MRLGAAKAHLQVCQPVGEEMAYGGMWCHAVAHLGLPPVTSCSFYRCPSARAAGVHVGTAVQPSWSSQLGIAAALSLVRALNEWLK